MVVLFAMFIIVGVSAFISIWIVYMYVPIIKLNDPELYTKIKGDLDSSFDDAPGVLVKHWRADFRFYKFVIKGKENRNIPVSAQKLFKYCHLVHVYGGVLLIPSFFGFVFVKLYESPLFN